MNARIILAAVAAVCCVQGISAAAVAKPLPEHHVADLGSLEAADVLESLMLTLQHLEEEEDDDLELTPFHVQRAKDSRGARNIFGCVTSVTNTIKTLLEAKALLDEFNANKTALKKAEKKCSEAADAFAEAGETVSDDDCLAKAQAAFQKTNSELKGKIAPLAAKAVATLISLKSCASLL